ncbi:MAG: hypothetical protein ACFE0O_07565 [Opitutales bacterium]
MQLESNLLQLWSNLARVESDCKLARLTAEVNKDLYDEGLLSDRDDRTSVIRAETAETQYAIERQRVAFPEWSGEPRIQAQQADTRQTRNRARLLPEQVENLSIGDLPKGARPDLPVEGTSELENLRDVLYVGRHSFARENRTVSVFRLEPAGNLAVRTPVTFGRTSANTIEIVRGLNAGDRIIISDTTEHDSHDRIEVN